MAYATIEQTLNNCAALMQTGAHMVKLEVALAGGDRFAS
jgi:3-methyl-2-oxobutanoate hydroxymethyltransferase